MSSELAGGCEHSARQKPEILMTAITDGKIKQQLLGKISQIKTKLKGIQVGSFIAFFFVSFNLKALISHQPMDLEKWFDWRKQFFLHCVGNSLEKVQNVLDKKKKNAASWPKVHINHLSGGEKTHRTQQSSLWLYVWVQYENQSSPGLKRAQEGDWVEPNNLLSFRSILFIQSLGGEDEPTCTTTSQAKYVSHNKNLLKPDPSKANRWRCPCRRHHQNEQRPAASLQSPSRCQLWMISTGALAPGELWPRSWGEK